MPSKSIRRIAAAVVLASVLVQPASATIQTIALRGQSPYSDSSDVAFGGFSLPSINNRGQVAFSATLTGEGLTTFNDNGIWIAAQGSFDQVAREGEPVPGANDDSYFFSISSLIGTSIPFSDTGEVVFRSYLGDADGGNNIGTVWAGRGGALRLIVSTGMQAPGSAEGETFYTENARASINRSGKVALASNFDAFRTSISDGLWIETDDGLQPVAVIGQEAPAMGEGVVLSSVPLATSGPLVNSRGEVAFRALLAGPGIDSQNNDTLWVGSPGTLTNLTREPMQIEALGSGINVGISTPTGFSMNRSVAVEAYLSGLDINGSNSTAYALADPEGVSIVARSGDPAEGAEAGRVYTGFSYEPVIGGGGHVAFYGGDLDPSDWPSQRTGIWAGLPGQLERVVRQGDPAPGTDDVFYAMYRNTPALNRFGQIAFPVQLEVPGTSTRSDSIWATDIEGNLTMIARVGQSLEVAPGDERTIRWLHFNTFHGDDDGRPRSLNDFGQVVFHAEFTDGSYGLFLSNAVRQLPGDYDRNGVVDAGDYVVWRRSLGQIAENLAADGNRDNRVDADDFAIWTEFFGQVAEASTATIAGPFPAVPEPASGVLLAMSLGALVRARKRSH
jgi:hypothetical protein